MGLALALSKKSVSDYVLDALNRSLAVIEFKPDGTIVTANPNFLNAIGYTLQEIQGQHHRMFVDPAYAGTLDYARFWSDLGQGKYQAAEYKRIAKGGKEIWIQATYNPVIDDNGKVIKVIKFATDTTAIKLKNAEYEGKLNAIDKAQAVIEFKLDGTILTANQNFLSTLGYSLDEIVGKHHRMFVDPAEVNGQAYRQFWEDLASGKFQAAQYKRIGKGGKEVWIEASYNPIFDMNGKPFKVVKFATDITKQIELLKSVKNLVDTNLSEIARAVEVVGQQATSASSGALQTTSNVQAVASGAEELHASVQEISQNMTKSKQESDDAYGKVVSANEDTKKLAAAALAMNGIVELIQDIASQVNLLSLNATIEAARAGEAGKGFAVVATEVKNLAGQASEATNRIGDEISGIQKIVDGVVSSLEDVRVSIDGVRNYVTGVAGAVEEQSAVAQDMSSNMQSAAQAVNDVSASLSQIVEAVGIVKQAVDTTTEAASSLAK